MLRQKTRLGKSPSKKKKWYKGSRPPIPKTSLHKVWTMHAILISEASVSTEVVGSSLAWPEGAVKGSPQKKCSPRRLPSLNEPENFVKSLIRIHPFNFRSLGSRCRKGLVTCHARRCNKIRLQAKSCKWATIQIKSKISSASPSFYDWKLLYSCC